MAARKYHRVLATNPRSDEAELVVRGGAKYYLIIPIGEELFEIHYGGKYLGESTSLSGAESFIKRGGASAPVLIQNPSGGYEMYKYNTPAKSNPKKGKKKSKKRGKKRSKKAAKKRGKKKSTKKKSTKKKSKKRGKKKAAKRKTAKKKGAGRKKKKATKKRGKKKASKRKSKKSTKRKAKKAPKKKGSGRKKKAAAKTSEPKKKVSVDSAVRNHIAKSTGKRPAW